MLLSVLNTDFVYGYLKHSIAKVMLKGNYDFLAAVSIWIDDQTKLSKIFTNYFSYSFKDFECCWFSRNILFLLAKITESGNQTKDSTALGQNKALGTHVILVF